MSFETKDSGKREEFAGGMVRDTQGDKTLFHLVYDGPMFKRWAELLTRGAKKYAEKNWMKASGDAEFNRFKASAARHFFQWYTGDQDEDHAAAVIFNVNGAEYVKDQQANKRAKAEPEVVPIEEYEKRVGDVKNYDDPRQPANERSVYLMGEPGKKVLLVPQDLQDDFYNVLKAKDNDAVLVTNEAINLISQFSGIPAVFVPELDKPYHEPYLGQTIPPVWNPVTMPYGIRELYPSEEAKVTPFLDLIRQRREEGTAAYAESLADAAWAMPPKYKDAAGEARCPTIFEQIRDGVETFVNLVKSYVARKLHDLALSLDPYLD